MPLIILLILAVVQGLTEFLPISSSGHLNILYNVMGIENNTLLLSIILHLATLLSVMIYYRKDILPLICHPFCKTNRKIFVTTFFTGIVFLTFKPLISKFFSTKYLFIFFIITAFLLFISDFMSEDRNYKSRISSKLSENKLLLQSDILNMQITYKEAIAIGLTQGIATIPGISRSGSTIAISGLMGVKCDKAKYSFLISIPIILLSLVYTLISGEGFSNINILALIISFAVCFLVGLLSIKWVAVLSHKNTLSYFGYYLLILSTFLILNSALLHWF